MSLSESCTLPWRNDNSEYKCCHAFKTEIISTPTNTYSLLLYHNVSGKYLQFYLTLPHPYWDQILYVQCSITWTYGKQYCTQSIRSRWVTADSSCNVDQNSCPSRLYHVIGFSALVDLWVIKIKKPMILCALYIEITWTEDETQITQRQDTWKVCLFLSQNNKIEWLSKMADTFLEKFTRCAKVCGLFFLIVRLGCWLAGQANFNHVILGWIFLVSTPWHWLSSKAAFPVVTALEAVTMEMQFWAFEVWAQYLSWIIYCLSGKHKKTSFTTPRML